MMPTADGRFKGAAYPHIPWETEADRRRQRQEQGQLKEWDDAAEHARVAREFDQMIKEQYDADA